MMFPTIWAWNGETDAGVQVPLAVIVERDSSVIGNLKMHAEKGFPVQWADKYQLHPLKSPLTSPLRLDI
jgi:hypothetical protein